MYQAVNRVVDAIVGFLLGAFKRSEPGTALPSPPPFPVGTPPTPPPLPVDPPHPVPLAQPLTLRLAEFVGRWNHTFVPPKFGQDFQCVALVNAWVDSLGLPIWPRLAAAGDFVYRAVPYFVFIPNTPTNYPIAGDIVEWGKSPSLPWGHIGVAMHADIMHLFSFDQNWPLHTPAHEQAHTYAGVTGWHRPLTWRGAADYELLNPLGKQPPRAV